MAFDTQAERLSIAHLLLPCYPSTGWPDGDIDQADRQDFIWLYRGLLAPSSVVPAVFTIAFNVYRPGMNIIVKKPVVGFTTEKPEVKVVVL